MLAVRGQQQSVSTHERVFLWKCQRFWDRKWLDLGGTRTLNLRIHAECSNLLSYQGHTFAVPCFEHWLWRYRYFRSNVNIWNVNCARATAFLFDTRTGFLVKVSKVLRQKMSRPERNSNPPPPPPPPTIGFMPNALTTYLYIYIYLFIYKYIGNVWSAGIPIYRYILVICKSIKLFL